MMKRTRRLLTLGHSYVVGVNRRLAHEMSSAGGDQWEVVAAAPTFFGGYNDLRPLHLHLRPEEAGKVVPLKAYFTKHIHAFVYEAKLRNVLAQNWDVVHCWEEPYIMVGGQVALFAPRKTRLVFRTAQGLQKRYPSPFSQIERYSMSRAAGWICSGRIVAGALGDRAGYRDKPMRCIPLGVDRERFFPNPAARAKTLSTLGWEEGGPPIVGFLGRFYPEKGLTLLMEALDRVRAPWRALLVGAGAMESEVRAWAEKHPGNVRVCTDVEHEEVPAYLNAMDLLCAPSQTMSNWKEQFGRMLIEGFATGVPVMGSDSGEIPFVLEEAGVVLPEKDVDTWSAEIAALIESPSRRAEMREKGLAAAADRYAWPVVARQYLDFFESLS